ncbi:MAG TPA: exodeoxyribonuclease VII large subunit [Rhizomicrobium sp.]|jgi:exodeoxyribonuclease VII large subunit|nr:exodeoxyribonuclease VII large subunit [Rhizomicrobium sp.]
MSDAAAKPVPNLPEFSVSELSFALKRTVEDAFPFVRVRGEVSKVTFQSSGHVYFDLKDDKAVLNAVCWRGTVSKLKVRPQQGLEVVCTGRISTYPGSSRYQIVVEQVELAGLGALMALLEERRKKLAAEGLFDAAHKKKLPFLPEVIGLVTSPTGAVLRDIMHRLAARFPRRVLLWPVAVQGERAAAEIAAAVRGFNALPPGGRLPRPDLLIVARGGGSIEDLMAFNEETVIRAVFDGTIPLISAVGHETDTTLIDFVSDVRAPTPTAAAELAVPVRTELLGQALDFERRLLRSFAKGMDDRRRHLAQLVRVLPRAEQLFSGPRQRLDHAGENLGKALRTNLQVHDRRLIKAAAALRPGEIRQRIKRSREQTDALANRLVRAHRIRLAEYRRHIDSLGRILESSSYKSALERGFALVRGEDGAIRRRAVDVMGGEHLTLTFADGQQGATADGDAVPKPKLPRKVPGSQGSLF